MIARSYGSFAFRNFLTVFYSRCTILHYYQWLCKGSCFSTSCQSCHFLPDRCKVSHCGLDFLFPDDWWFEHLFMFLLAIFMYLEKSLFKSTVHFIIVFVCLVFEFLLLSCSIPLYILDTNPSSHICKYCLSFCRLSFTLLIISFALQNLLFFDIVYCSFFAFVTYADGFVSIKPLPRSMSRRIFFPVLL